MVCIAGEDDLDVSSCSYLAFPFEVVLPPTWTGVVFVDFRQTFVFVP